MVFVRATSGGRYLPQIMAEPAAQSADSRQCRICLESEGELLAPCDCKGTARFAHAACIAEWQASQQQRRGSAHRCTRCDICGAKYNGLPQPPPRPLAAVWREHVADYLGTAGSLMSASSFKSVLFLSCVIWNLIDGRWRTAEKWVAAWEYFQLVSMFVGPWSVGLHIFLVRNNLRLVRNSVEGVRVIRFGLPVDGLEAGSLLVFLDNRGVNNTAGPFDHTVLYLIEHDDERGSVAVVLNRPMLASKPRQSDQQATARREANGFLHVELRDGGPVCKEAWHALHSMGTSGLPGSRRIFPPQSGNAPVARTRGADADAPPIYIAECESPHSLYDLPDAVLRAAAVDGGMVALMSGTAQWGPGQLAGEVRNGSWGWVEPRFQKRRWFAMALSRDADELSHAERDEPGRSDQYRLWKDVAESPFIDVCLPGLRR